MIDDDITADIDSVKRFFERYPNAQGLPAGFTVSDTMANRMKVAAQNALFRDFRRMTSEPNDSSHEIWMEAALNFAISALILCVDRETCLGMKAPKVNVPELWNWPCSTSSLLRNRVISDGVALDVKRQAQQALTDDGLALFEKHCCPSEMAEALSAGAKFFALATLMLAEDREARSKETQPLTAPIQ